MPKGKRLTVDQRIQKLNEEVARLREMKREEDELKDIVTKFAFDFELKYGYRLTWDIKPVKGGEENEN